MFDAIGIVTKNISRTILFYSILGLEFTQFEKTEHYEAQTVHGVRFMLDSFSLMTKIHPGYEMPEKSNMSLCFKQQEAKDVDDLFLKLSCENFEVLKKPWDAFWGQRYACVLDPNGNQIDIFADL